jgi:CPA2 family monovalent cation:H+ antiporter-2
MNVNTVRSLRQLGIAAIYGDAMLRETLESAGLAQSNTLILTSAGMANGADAIRTARELNPGLHVMARGSYLRDVPALRAAGADTVFTGEGEVALAFAEALLRRLGATPEQIERERSRARAHLFGVSD